MAGGFATYPNEIGDSCDAHIEFYRIPWVISPWPMWPTMEKHRTHWMEDPGRRPCPQTASLLVPRHASPECEDRWTPKSIEDIVLHTMQKKIGKVRFIVIYFYELDFWWFLPTSKSFWGFTTLVNLGWSFQVGIVLGFLSSTAPLLSVAPGMRLEAKQWDAMNLDFWYATLR